MADTSNSLSWLPGFLIVLGLFMLAAAVVTDGPDRVGAIVFGALSLAAAGAILYRRAHDARSQSERTDPDGDTGSK